MISLIMKDFIIQKKNLKNYILIGLFLGFIFTFNENEQLSFVLPIFLIIFGFIGRASYEDEANHSIRWIAALPIKKATVVQARYISVALASIFTVLIFELIKNTLVSLKVITIEAGSESSLPFFLVILVFVAIISVYMPMIYKMGYIRAANVYRFIIFGFLGLSILIGKIVVPSGSPPEMLLDFAQWISTISEITVILGIGIVSILIYLISMGVSIGIYSRRNYF